MSPYNGDSSFIEITDLTGDWSAGYGSDSVTLNVVSWDDSQIIIQGLGGGYGTLGWSLNTGDQLEIQVVNPQTGLGPAIFSITVGQ